MISQEITASEAEILFGLKENTLRVLRLRNRIDGRRAGPRQLFFKRRDVEVIARARKLGIFADQTKLKGNHKQ